MSLSGQSDLVSDLRFELIPAGGLMALSAEVEADPVKYAVAPIEPLRALAHSKNPVADPSDPALVIAWSEGRCVGYLGMIPIIARIDGARHKLLAMTTQFVHPDFRRKPPPGGSTIAEQMYQVVRSTGFDQLNTGFNPTGGGLHKRRPDLFTPLPSYTFLRIRLTPMQPVSSLLRRMALRWKIRPFRILLGLTKRFIDRPIGGIIGWLLRISLNAGRQTLISNPIDKIDPSPTQDYSEWKGINFSRSAEVVNWMTMYPWHEVGAPKHPRFYFSNPRERFDYHSFQLRERSGRSVGSFVISISTEKLYTTLKIVDYRASLERPEINLLSNVISLALREGVNQIECAGEYFALIERSRLLRSLTTLHRREYYMSLLPGSPFEGRISEIQLDYPDGERAFV